MAIFIEIIVLIVVLVLLILVHEIGHFIVAKISGMRVDEFGIGYPPRALTIAKIGDTEYTLNWLPFGGFVRIYGEDSNNIDEPDSRAFASRPRILQALVLVSGVVMNIILAYILLTATLIIGTPQQIGLGEVATAKNPQVVLESVTPGTPAARAGFMPGDIITKATLTTKLLAESYNGTNAEGYSTLVASDADGDPLTFMIIRGGKTLNITAIPVEKIIPGAPTRPALGFTMTEIAIVKTSADQAPTQGVYYTWNVTKETAVGLYDFFKHIVLFKADLSQVSGPIGIAGAVGTATSQGAAAVLTLAGLISINLAIINLLPIPALDGGRLLFVIIESIIRRPLNPKIAERVNLVGFALLILLMLVVSAHDIFKLIH